jgi:hypothetical protein
LNYLNLSYNVNNFDNSRLFGRLSQYKPNILLDVGHNVLAARSIYESLIDFKYTFWPKKLIEKKVFKLVDAYLVREGDVFSVEIDDGKTKLQHKLNPFNTSSPIIGSYARGILYNGEVVIAIATKEELEKAKKSAQLKARGKGTAWDVWYEEVAKKVPIKRLVKMIPIPDEIRMAEAIEGENYASPSELIEAEKNEQSKQAINELKREVETNNTVVTLKDALEDMKVEYELKKGWVKIKKELIPKYLIDDLKLFEKDGHEGFLIGKLLQEVKYSFEPDEDIVVEPVE